MTKINMIGDVFGTTGYAIHTRNLANALNNAGHDVRLVTQVPQGWERMITDAENLMLKKADDRERVNIIITIPHLWPAYCTAEKNIGFLVWEGDRIPKSYVNNILSERIKQVWVPSKHVKEAIAESVKEFNRVGDLIMQKVKVVPHGVDLKHFQPSPNKPEKTTFLCNKGFRNNLDRGGIQYAIKAFDEEFKPGEAKLFIKFNPAYSMPPEMFNRFLDEIKMKNRDDIMATWDAIPYEDLHLVYERGTVFLNPTRGEAFSIPCIEAMAMGLPVITTGFGGQTDYVNDQNGWIVPYDLEEVKHEVQYEGVKWAVPHTEALRKAMRKAYDDKEGREEKAKNALETAKAYTWESSARTADVFLRELENRKT